MPSHEMESNMPMRNDRVRVIVPPHMEGHDLGTVRQVCDGALGIEFDNMVGEIHHWYVPSEVVIVERPMPEGSTMNRSYSSIKSFSNRDVARAAWKSHFHNRSLTEKKQSKLEVRNLDATSVEILLYDEIGFWGVTAKEFATTLAGITAASIVVRINSPGGDVFDGLAIYNSLQAHPATIKTQIDGWAASAASFIALAGESVTIAQSAFMMIHKAWGITLGNADDHRDMVMTLDKIDGQLSDIYAKKTAKPKAEILALMKGESDGTWFTADEAKAMGLADTIVDGSDEVTTADELPVSQDAAPAD